MFKSKINGSFKDEFESSNKIVNQIIKELKRKGEISKFLYITFSLLLIIINITTIIIASFALSYSIKNNISIMTTGFVAGLIIFLFLFGLFISIYQGSMKAKVYKEIFELIQEEVLTYELQQNEYKTQDEKLLLKNIMKITHKENNKKNKRSLHKIILSSLMGGNGE